MTLNQITGTENNDILLDTNLDDEISALGGNDEIETTGGNDIVYGDSGTDKLTVNYAAYNEDLNVDIPFYDPSIGNGSITIDLFTNGSLTSNLIDFYSIEQLELTTGRGNDTVSQNPNNISDDTINAGAGDDWINAGKGYDIVDGGSGYDILALDFSTNFNGITSNLSSSNSGEYISDEGVVEFSNIEAIDVIGSSYDDVLAVPVGNSSNNSSGFIPRVDGGEGFDELVVDLSDRTEGLRVENFGNLDISSYDNPNYYNNLDLNSIEGLNITTGRGNDEIIFDDYNNISDDTINAGAGDDWINAGKGYDIVDGGSGYDILALDFSTNFNGITSNLSSSNSGEYISDEGVVEFSNIEAIDVIGSSYDDVLAVPVGNSSNNSSGFIPRVDGGEGFDELVVDLSDRTEGLHVDNLGSLNIISYDNPNYYNHLDIQNFEGINLTTGRGNDEII